MFGPKRLRPADPRAGTNVTITADALGVIIAASGSATPADDSSAILATRAYNHPPVRGEEAQAGTNITITRNALGPVISASGSSTPVDDASAVLAGIAYQPRPLPPPAPPNDSQALLAVLALMPHPVPRRRVKAGSNVTVAEDAEGSIVSVEEGIVLPLMLMGA